MAAPSRDPINLPVRAVNQWQAATASPHTSAVAECWQQSAAPRRFGPDAAHRLLSTTVSCLPSLGWQAVFKTSQ